MNTVIVSPASIRPGDKILTGHGKTRTIKRVSVCAGKAECVHLDHECYDMRFSTVEKVES